MFFVGRAVFSDFIHAVNKRLEANGRKSLLFHRFQSAGRQFHTVLPPGKSTQDAALVLAVNFIIPVHVRQFLVHVNGGGIRVKHTHNLLYTKNLSIIKSSELKNHRIPKSSGRDNG